MLEWHAVKLPLLCFGTAILELDALHVGQWMVSRPLVLGPIIGLACGKPAVGVWIGILMEFITLDDLPVGCVVPLNSSIAAASAILLAAGPYAVAPAAAFPAGLILGSFFCRLETLIRAGRVRLTRLAHESLEAGRPIPFGQLVGVGLGWHAAAAMVFLYAGVAILGPAIAWGWNVSPEYVRNGLGIAFTLAQCLGWATLVFSLRPR